MNRRVFINSVLFIGSTLAGMGLNEHKTKPVIIQKPKIEMQHYPVRLQDGRSVDKFVKQRNEYPDYSQAGLI